MLSSQDAISRLRCSFCGSHQRDVARLVAGPLVFICDGCVRIASGQKTAPGIVEFGSDLTLTALPPRPCSFCGQLYPETEQLIIGGKAAICRSCLLLTHDVAQPSLPVTRGSWIELSAAALRANAAVFRKVLGAGRFGAVLKANAYGHGLMELLPIVRGLVDALYLIAPEDALRIRKLESEAGLPRKQLIVIGAIAPEEQAELARQEIDVVLADHSWPAAAQALKSAGLRARVHIHIDTGLGREGFTVPELPALAEGLQSLQDTLQVVGVLSHFSNTEDVTEQGYALSQVAAFEEGFNLLQKALQLPPTTQRHFAASAAAMVLPQARYDLARIGVALYGLWPSTETRLSARLVLNEVPQLEPVLSWKCRSQAVKTLPAGAYVGYGCTCRCSRETRVAVLPVGYYDGYPRLLSSRAHVLVNGTRCPVLGRVMMNHIVVDITGAGAEGSSVVATLLGIDGAEQVSAEMLASWAQTINYEVVARLGAHLKRVVT